MSLRSTSYMFPCPRPLQRLAVKMLSHPTTRSVCGETLIQHATSCTRRCLQVSVPLCFTIYTFSRPTTLERLAREHSLTQLHVCSARGETLIHCATSYTCRCLQATAPKLVMRLAVKILNYPRSYHECGGRHSFITPAHTLVSYLKKLRPFGCEHSNSRKHTLFV